MSIYTDLNCKTEKNRFENWKQHRETLNSFLSESLKLLPDFKRKNVLVVGAGNCDDMDIGFLTAKFSEVYLCDIDVSTLKSSLTEKYPDCASNVEILDFGDLTGLDSIDFFNKAKAALNDSSGIQPLIKHALDNLEHTYQRIVEFKSFFSSIIVLPIYTQLPLPILLNVSRDAYESRISDINMVCDFLNLALNEHIDFLMADESFIFAYSDFLDMNLLDDSLKESLRSRLSDLSSRPEALDEIKDDYKDFISLGSTGLEDLASQEFYSPLMSFVLSWPYSSSKNYLCEGVSIRVQR